MQGTPGRGFDTAQIAAPQRRHESLLACRAIALGARQPAPPGQIAGNLAGCHLRDCLQMCVSDIGRKRQGLTQLGKADSRPERIVTIQD
jgi:hypothetical protein